jgi:hypothetical protein
MRPRTQSAPGERGAARAERRLGEGVTGDWDEMDDDFQDGLTAPAEGDEVRFINREVNEFLSDLDS